MRAYIDEGDSLVFIDIWETLMTSGMEVDLVALRPGVRLAPVAGSRPSVLITSRRPSELRKDGGVSLFAAAGGRIVRIGGEAATPDDPFRAVRLDRPFSAAQLMAAVRAAMERD